jgi:hypothetical protein
MRILVAAICLLCALAHVDQTLAQQRKPTRKRSSSTQTARGNREQKPSAPAMPVLPDIRNDPEVQAADVAIIANITAKELRIDVVPNPTVEFLGKDKTQTVWHADRYNLPDKIEPGVTYRNIGIRLKITSTLADIERIVSEALGEVPITDNSASNTDERRQESGIAPSQSSPNNPKGKAASGSVSPTTVRVP